MADKKEKKYVSDNAQLMAEWDCENILKPVSMAVISHFLRERPYVLFCFKNSNQTVLTNHCSDRLGDSKRRGR